MIATAFNANIYRTWILQSADIGLRQAAIEDLEAEEDRQSIRLGTKRGFHINWGLFSYANTIMCNNRFNLYSLASMTMTT